MAAVADAAVRRDLHGPGGVARVRVVVVVLAVAGAAQAGAVLVGWMLGTLAVPSFASGTNMMVPWTAVGCLSAAAGVLVWTVAPPGVVSRLLTGVGAALTLSIGLGSVIENLFGISFGVDSLLWPATLSHTAQQYPGRTSLQTAIALALFGAALITVLVVRPQRRASETAGLVGLGVGTLGVLGLAGRALQISATFSSAQLGAGGLSVPTGIALLTAGMALFAAGFGPSLLELVPRSVAARRAMRVLPGTIAAPIVVFLCTYLSLEASGIVQVVGPLVTAAIVVGRAATLRLINSGVFEDVTRHAEEQRQLSDRVALYGAAVESSEDAILTADLESRITGWNPASQRMYGYPPDVALGLQLDLIVAPGGQDRLRQTLGAVSSGRPAQHLDMIHVRRDGESFPTAVTVSPVRDGSERLVGVSLISRDMTDSRRSEELLARRTEELQQAQKMEAIGRLAGGIAHDFNNVLMVIVGSAHLLADDESLGDEARELGEEITQAAQRATSLIKQLLAFGRKSPITPESVDPNQLLTDIRAMLKRLLGSDIEIVLELEPRAGHVNGDPTQLHQVIMNLAINAKDAMPDGGRLTLRTRLAQFDDDPAAPSPGAPPGEYVEVMVADTGTGIPPEVLGQVFEPFFTTKEPGRGTGLGLSTTYGILTQLGGAISVDSVVGDGTTFSILLPRHKDESAHAPAVTTDQAEPATAGHTVLLVDDQERPRTTIARMLSGLGYQVMQAHDASEASLVHERHSQEIDLLMTDVSMPGADGYELARTLRSRRPYLPVICISANPPSAAQSASRDVDAFVSKPFTPEQIKHEIRRVLSIYSAGPSADSDPNRPSQRQPPGSPV